MTIMDKWGQNPEILMMRQIFRQMEAGQDNLIKKLGISVLDSRLPRWRQQAMVLFEQYWHQCMGSTGKRDETQADILYSRCLARVMRDDGVQLPADIVSVVEQVNKLMKEDGS